jgi:hypothetical protein
MAPPTYHERLRIEGATLAAAGAAGSALVLATQPQARRWPLNTAGQLAATAALLASTVPKKTRGALDAARELPPGEEGDGEPTPLWLLPVIVAGLCVPVVAAPPLPGPLRGVRALEKLRERAGWDAALRVTAGSALAGLAQALLAARVVDEAQARTGRTYVRAAGSSLLGGTRVGYLAQSRNGSV